MAQYPIKMLKDENGTPFVPLVAPEAVKDTQGTNWQTLIDKKLEKTNIIAGDNITLSVSGNDITINSQAGGTSDYSDLTNKPKINNVELSGNKSLSDLGITNFSGDYNDLSNKPSLDTTSGVSLNPLKEEINGEISLHKIAKTGNYEDLLYKPIIPITFTNNTKTDYAASELPQWQIRLLQQMINEYRLDNNSINNYILKVDGIMDGEDTSSDSSTHKYSSKGKDNRLYTFKKSGPIGNIPHAFQFVGPTSLSYDDNPNYDSWWVRFDNQGIIIYCDNNYRVTTVCQRYQLYDEGRNYAQIRMPNDSILDGDVVFGKYASAASGENLTENYGVTSRDIEKLRIGTKWRWRSSVQPRANNIGIIYYTNTYSALIPGGHGREYSVVNVSMNGNYYQYAYDWDNVYKEIYPGTEGTACFGKDTKVWTKTGEKTIDKVELGDEVLAYDWCKDRVVYAPIVKIFSHEQEEVYHIILENDNDLYVTGDHPILERDKGKIPASMIKKGHVLMNDKGVGYLVKSNRKVKYNDTVYEIRMEGNVLNYFVGDSKIMVFNEIITGEA